jgi:diaminohydroxyphosphoribosylaminopyrimidine deaminase/5-amino-6-(5-phosphoribosylamino)uracil reductase
MRTGFPWIQLKLGASLDGRTAMASGESQWITSPQARRDVQRLRAQSHAILTSSATVLADDPKLTVRWEELSPEIQGLYPQENLRQPVRIVVDSQHRVTPEHALVQQPGRPGLRVRVMIAAPGLNPFVRSLFRSTVVMRTWSR